jgi:hypothetical protein
MQDITIRIEDALGRELAVTAGSLQEPQDPLTRHKKPLKRREAEWLAAKLRSRYGGKLSYTAIAVLMGEYHDVWLAASTWEKACKARGCAATRPNNGFAMKEKARA